MITIDCREEKANQETRYQWGEDAFIEKEGNFINISNDAGENAICICHEEIDALIRALQLTKKNFSA